MRLLLLAFFGWLVAATTAMGQAGDVDLRLPVGGQGAAAQPAEPGIEDGAGLEEDGDAWEEMETVDPRLAWSDFELAQLDLGQVVVHFELPMANQMAAVRRAIESHMTFEQAERQRADQLIVRAENIVRDLHELVGVESTDQNVEEHTAVLVEALEGTPRLINVPPPLHVYVVRQEAIKAKLRGGGELPGFGYDAATDEAEYYFGVVLGGPEDALVGVLALPVTEDEPLAAQVTQWLEALRVPQRAAYGSALHDTAQVMILSRLEPGDPYYRWFVEGFSTAVALQMLERHGNGEAVAAFRIDSSDYRDMLDRTNLYYWMDAGYEVATPLESEARLSAARYALAVEEARLLMRNRPGVLKAILDQIAVMNDGNRFRRLDDAIAGVTGVDIEQRFRRYQTFATREAGIEQYSRQSNAALDEENYAGMLPNVLRIMELREKYEPGDYANAALILYRMGAEALADEVYAKQLALLEATGQAELLHEMRLRHLQYALHTDEAWKAYGTAEELLAKNADYVPALAVRMQRYVEEADFDNAGLTAQRILAVDKTPGSPYPKLARELLEQLEPVEGAPPSP